MDTSEENVEQSRTSPPRRRRSTFFVRRESLAPVFHAENPLNITKEDERRSHNEGIAEYYNALSNEKASWKEELTRTKKAYHELRLQCKMAQNATNSMESQIYSVLDAEDIEFINKKVNLSQLFEKQQALHKAVQTAVAFYRKATELDNVIMTNVGGKNDRIQEYICENSTMDFVEN